MAESLETRKCILSGKTASKDELLRFAVLPDGRLIPDFNKKLDGRGVYLSNSKQMLIGLTQKEKPLNKILHKNVVIDADLPQMVENILFQKALDAVNLARKAGDLVLGFEKVRMAITKGKAAFVIEAKDAGDDGKQKIAAMAKEIETINVFDTAAMSNALNRENTVYLAILKGQTAEMVHQALIRYQTFVNE
ncbi:MAG: DUF448 domain-containing protein [Alphaproteobacteria bacterium]|nr:DUF448 domain-containing protein [Alphaproteobacteria bacterium]